MAQHENEAVSALPGEDPEFQEATWRVQRWLKGALFIVVLAALGGAFGGSPWLDRTATDGAFQVKYPFLMRQQSAIEWRVALESKPELWFTHSLIDAFDIEMILPEPETKTSDHGRLTLTFPAGTQDVRIRVRAKRWGKIAGEGGSGQSNTALSMWGWP